MMHHYFGRKPMALEEAIEIVTLRIENGEKYIHLETEFSVILIELKRKNYVPWKYRVQCATKESAPMSSRLVQGWIQKGFDYYVSINFATGVDFHHDLLTFFVAYGLCSAFVHKIYTNTHMYENVTDIGLAAAMSYMNSISRSISPNDFAEALIRTTTPVRFLNKFNKGDERIELLETILRNLSGKVSSKLNSASAISGIIRYEVTNSFWVDMISMILRSTGIMTEALRNKLKEGFLDDLETNYKVHTDSEMLIEWIRYVTGDPRSGYYKHKEKSKEDKKDGKKEK